jgi:hypothetical protein
MAVLQTVRHILGAINGAAIQGQQSGQGDRYGLDAHPCLRYRDGGSRAAGAERISGRGMKSQLNRRLKLSDAERAMLGKIGHRLGRHGVMMLGGGMLPKGKPGASG